MTASVSIFGIAILWLTIAAAAFSAGLLVGWWLLPQPGFMRRIGIAIGAIKE